MTAKPYHTHNSIVRTARQKGHVVHAEGGEVSIDTGEDMIVVSEKGIKDRVGNDISIDSAMDTISKTPEA